LTAVACLAARGQIPKPDKPSLEELMANRNVAHAVRVALIAAGAVSTAAYAPGVLAQDTELEEVVVTGSRVKRIDTETASPVFSFDSEALSLSGAAIMGDVITKAPSIAGAATNPQVNNGGGTGATTVSLRGLGSARTLVLVNGRRSILGGDINAIPMNFVERVEILKDGASATYGSDAIGGVVNFITRSEFEGVEASAQYGVTDYGDAGQNVLTFTLGTSSDRGSFMIGGNYNDREKVGAGDRPFSKEPWALYYGEKISLGSSRIPAGYYLIPRSALVASGFNPASDPNCSTTRTSLVVTRRDGTNGATGSDFRCYIGGGPNNDTYNFQPANVVVTPQKRYGLFVQGSYDLTENLEFFVEGVQHYTQAEFNIAPEPFDGRPIVGADVPVSALSYYNPWGDRVLGAGKGVNITDARKRLEDVGPRKGEFTTNRFEATAGLRGDIFTDWTWEAFGTYGTENVDERSYGELYTPRLKDALGPSFMDTDGVVKCGTPGNVISDCVPYNIFAVTDPAALAALVPERHGLYVQEDTHAGLNLSGDLFDLPAGKVGAAFGYSYDRYYQNDQPDWLEQQGLTSGNTAAAASGSFAVNTVYAELLVPILKDLPAAAALNVSLGASYADYSNFGGTDNYKVGLEWRPVSSLLVRGTYATVFRAPSIDDLYSANGESADSFQDPCNGLTAADLASNPNAAQACQNVPADGTYSQSDSQTNTIVGGNPDVQPEEGDVFTVGFLWNPGWNNSAAEFSVDYYKVSLDDTIGTFGTNTILRKCYTEGNFCDLYTRNEVGDVVQVVDTTQNVGELEADGLDFGFGYNFGETGWGNFRLRLDATYLLNWDNTQIAGDPTTLEERAGTFTDSATGGDGHFAEWRGLASVLWSMGGWNAALTTRYIGEVTEFVNATNCDASKLTDDELCPRNVGSQMITDIEAGYTMEGWGTTLTFGVNNVTNELAPIIYSGFNGTTDVRTYDGIGRFYFARINWKM
jgi:outer membrane receptor protein involved in Fe transport